MIHDNEFYVVVKLNSGEQVMAILNDEDDDYIELAYPMIIRMLPVIIDGGAHEHVTAAPLCQFSSDKLFRIPKTSVMFVKELHQIMIPNYKKLVDESEKTVLVKRDKHGKIEKPSEENFWGDENLEDLSTEEIRKRIAMLESIFDNGEEEEHKVFVEGNDTLH